MECTLDSLNVKAERSNKKYICMASNQKCRSAFNGNSLEQILRDNSQISKEHVFPQYWVLKFMKCAPFHQKIWIKILQAYSYIMCTCYKVYICSTYILWFLYTDTMTYIASDPNQWRIITSNLLFHAELEPTLIFLATICQLIFMTR